MYQSEAYKQLGLTMQISSVVLKNKDKILKTFKKYKRETEKLRKAHTNVNTVHSKWFTCQGIAILVKF